MSLATEPICFQPVYQKRVWGGRKLATKFGRELPDDGEPYGEAWDLVDREEAQSVVVGGAYDGMTLASLWNERRREVFGAEAPNVDRFPILVKILDARETLSVQVHPPAEVAEEFGGEAKNEFWWIVDAEPGAEIISGLMEGVNRGDFSAAAKAGNVRGLLCSQCAVEGDKLFLPSGRVHALGAGVAVIEIQDNSDTTYRVYDWGRNGLDGRPRELHLEQAVRSMGEVEPELNRALVGGSARFDLCELRLSASEEFDLGADGRMGVYVVAAGRVDCRGRSFGVCDSFLVPVERGGGDWGIRGGGDGAVILRARFRG